MAFKEILKSFEPMSVILRTNKYDAKRFQAWSGQRMALRDGPRRHFGADTQCPPSKAKVSVWGDGAKFAARKQALFGATDRLDTIPGTPDKMQATAACEAVENTCRNCHKTFKTR